MPRTRAKPAASRYDIEAAVPYLMNRIVSRLNQRLVDELRGAGLAFKDWRVLAFLAATRRKTIADLAAFSVVPHSTLSRLLARMERAGLLVRRDATHDLRAVELALTAEGRRLYERVLPLVLGLNRNLLVGFTAAERAGLRRALERMRDNLGLEGRVAAAPVPRRGRAAQR